MKTSLAAITLTLAGLLIVPTMASAQADAPEGARRGPRTAEEQVKALKESLSLTDEQTEKVKVVITKSREKMKAVTDDKSLSQEDRRAKMREIGQATQEELTPILTPEQQAKWKEEREKRRAARAGGQ